MQTADFVDIALAGLDDRDVEVAAMEPAEFSSRVVGALSQIVAELAGNATAFSAPSQKVTVEGVFVGSDYRIVISDDGVGIPKPMLEALNRVLATPPSTSGNGVSLGIAVVARLAARHDITVELTPGTPGTVAQVTIPEDLVTRPDVDSVARAERLTERPAAVPPRGLDVDAYMDELEEAEATARYEREHKSDPAHVVSMSEIARAEAEEFLETVFGPLRPSGTRSRPSNRTRITGEDRPKPVVASPSPETGPEPLNTDLEVRVPGVNFTVVDDERSVVSSEGAVDLKSALSSYQQGRKGASEGKSQRG